jgi:hypothetical protein
MNGHARSRSTLLLAARLHRALGWPGLLGLVLVLVALILVGLAPAEAGPPAVIPAAPALVHRVLPLRPASAKLPLPSQVPSLLTLIEQAAVSQGLGWPQADYREVGPSGDTPARLEVHCTLKGAYPDVRRFVATVLRDVPAATLGAFSLSRSSSETPTVEAHLTFAVFLQGAASMASPGSAP